MLDLCVKSRPARTDRCRGIDALVIVIGSLRIIMRVLASKHDADTGYDSLNCIRSFADGGTPIGPPRKPTPALEVASPVNCIEIQATPGRATTFAASG